MRKTVAKPLDIQVQPILVDAKQAAELCSMGTSLFYSLSSRGATPQPIRLSSKQLWIYDELRVWARHHCPSRDSAQWAAVLERLQNE